MSLIQFVNNYEDLSTDKGFQFKFYCDKCGNGYMSRFQPSYIGMAGSFLNAASNLLGWGHSAGNSAYEVQRAVGGSAHDEALKTAVEEGKQHFHQCSRCGKCWNEQANQCEECAPRFEEEMASAHAQAKAEAVRQQLNEKAMNTDYVSNIDMSAKSYVSSSQAVKPAQQSFGNFCASCGHNVDNHKFCPECGTPASAGKPTCKSCGCQPENATKFCPDCGTKMS
jgi:hypothetical protein